MKEHRHISLDTYRWRNPDFANLSFKHRSLMIVLECLADRAGVVEWDLGKFYEVSGKGVQFTRLDIDALGADNAVWLDDNYHILLSRFMKFQYKTLSRRSPAHVGVWSDIARWWGVPKDKYAQEPFMEFFAERMIHRHAPEIKNEEHGALETQPWKIDSLASIKRAQLVDIPESLPDAIRDALDVMFKWREKIAARCRTKTDYHKFEWDEDKVEADIRQIKSMLLKYTEESVEAQIRNMPRTNNTYLSPPLNIKNNLLKPNIPDHE